MDLPSAREGPDPDDVDQPNMTYTISVSEHRRKRLFRALMDRGANGNIISLKNFKVLKLIDDWVDLTGVKEHKF